ncbi:acyltransferase [Helicobacter bizzozeronii]|uniref:acyltransferase n=1 Tax=Helicobacter bizzozeronii TaxID=56877 RepID=UPI000CEEBE18|nr:acyltransferase [Helicobacter bizzozeronii]
MRIATPYATRLYVVNEIHPSAFIHPSSYLDDPIKIQEGVKIWHFCHLRAHTHIGAHVSMGQNCVVGPRVSIGAGSKIQNNVSLHEGVECQDHVFIGPSVVFTNVLRPRSFIKTPPSAFVPTLLKTGCSIGANATIICGVSIGAYAFVAAGSVVTKNVPDFGMVKGNPARFVGFVDKALKPLNFVNNRAQDSFDGSVYILEDQVVRLLES